MIQPFKLKIDGRGRAIQKCIYCKYESPTIKGDLSKVSTGLKLHMQRMHKDKLCLEK